jgi:chorismate mutase
VNEDGHRPVVCRGIRGATTVDENTAEAILEAARDLLIRIVEANDLRQEDIASVIFTTTPDLDAEYPALAARQMGWYDVALMCGNEMNVPHGLKMCLRILIHWNTTRQASEIQHIYVRGAVNLRPDRSIQFKAQPTTAGAQQERNP